MNGYNKLECYITKRFYNDKDPSLLGEFVGYEENEVMWPGTINLFTTVIDSVRSKIECLSQSVTSTTLV